ncbi:hypothetical protein LCGC14_2513620 [marine sediment metagenome]|uniref:Uncharacterized protein n=1 Tax=marine sediment metagenome TaxID=412755 RepID=A0A0F9BLD9_9ZZZZ
MNRYRITPEGHRLIETATKEAWPTWAGNDTILERADMANVLIKLDEESEDGIFSYYEYVELQSLGIEPLQLRQLVKEKLLEKLATEEEEEEQKRRTENTVDSFLYEKEVEIRIDEIEDELYPYQINHKRPPIELLKKYFAAKKEFNKLLGIRNFPI